MSDADDSEASQGTGEDYDHEQQELSSNILGKRLGDTND